MHYNYKSDETKLKKALIPRNILHTDPYRKQQLIYLYIYIYIYNKTSSVRKKYKPRRRERSGVREWESDNQVQTCTQIS